MFGKILIPIPRKILVTIFNYVSAHRVNVKFNYCISQLMVLRLARGFSWFRECKVRVKTENQWKHNLCFGILEFGISNFTFKKIEMILISRGAIGNTTSNYLSEHILNVKFNYCIRQWNGFLACQWFFVISRVRSTSENRKPMVMSETQTEFCNTWVWNDQL